MITGCNSQAGCDANALDKDGFTALHWACYKGINTLIQLHCLHSVIDTAVRLQAGFIMRLSLYDTIRYDRWLALENWQASC